MNYFFIEFCGKATCLICRESVSVFKEANVKRHYECKHKEAYDCIHGHARAEQAEALRKNFAKDTGAVKNMLCKQVKGKQNVVQASYKIASIIAAENQSFSSGEFVKRCMYSCCGR